MTKHKVDEGLFAIVSGVSSWRDDTSTLVADVTVQFYHNTDDGTVQEPEDIARLIGREVGVWLVGSKPGDTRHGRLMSMAAKVQKDGPALCTAKISCMGDIGSWAGRAITVVGLQAELLPVVKGGHAVEPEPRKRGKDAAAGD